MLTEVPLPRRISLRKRNFVQHDNALIVDSAPWYVALLYFYFIKELFPQATEVAFVLPAEGFSPAAACGEGISL
jgi:hypothetical protein